MKNTLNQKPVGNSRDAEARRLGYKSAAEMDAFFANRARMRARGGSKIPDGTPAPAPAPTQKKRSTNPLTRLLNGLAGKDE